MSLPRSVACSTTSLAAALAFAVSANAQSPWTLTIRPSTPTLQTGVCTPIRLELLDAGGRESPRNPNGVRVSIADFDWSVAAGGKVVGRYDGASAWSACACPASAGVSATITATYPAQALAQKARVPGVAFQSSINVPVVAWNSSGVPIGCETSKTTTVPAGSAAPWAVTLTTGVSALTIGGCSPIYIDLRDATGKERPRNPASLLISLADFDMTVAGAGDGAVVGQYNGASDWATCACQGAAIGSLATITATYPAGALAQQARVPGVAFQASIKMPLAAARGTFNPPGCSAPAAKPIAAAGTGRTAPPPILGTAPTGTPVAVQPVPAATPVAVQPAPARTPVSTTPGPAPIGVTVTGTPASATLGWQPVAGVASYVVTRQQANVPPTSQTLAATNTGMYDSGLQPATAYTYTVRAIQADGRAGSTDVTFTTPPAVNPTGFTARQTGDGQVKLWWQPVNDASYYVLFGPGAQGGTKVDTAITYTVMGVPPGTQEWAIASYYDPGPVSTVGTEFTKVQLTVNAFLLSGWVDLHTHPMINLAFGGKLIHGGVDVGSLLPADASCNKGVRATAIDHALGDDRPSHGGWNLITFPCGDDLRKLLIHEFQQGNAALTTASPAYGFPIFDQWPKWNDITHQKMWFEWIRRARDGGLRVMVALATNNKTLADAMSGGSPITGTADGATDDKTSGNLQLTEINAFVGRHNDFMEVALGPADVKRIVQANKIAVVLGVELDNLGNFNTLPVAALPLAAAQALIATEIQRLYDAGARYIFPIHVLDNVFGGTAIYEHGFNTSNLREAGHYWDIECADVSDNITHTYQLGTDALENILKSTVALIKLGIDPFRRPGPPPVCPGGQPGKSFGHRNALGLTQYGVIAVKEMMKRGMIVDIDHMSQKAADATLAIAESFGYPLVSGHTGIRGLAGSDAENSRTPRQMERISRLHGMFGLGSDGAHAFGWAQLYQSAMITMGYLGTDTLKAHYRNGAVSLGTDLNGLVKGPKPGGGNRIKYDASFPISTSITKSWDYNTEGVAHYGMLADFVRDVKNAPSNGYMAAGGVPLGVVGAELVDHHLMRSADYFWRMWERIEARKVNVQ
jgi:microsomal dipeptidase-like Zn-dependent dipeptidase